MINIFSMHKVIKQYLLIAVVAVLFYTCGDNEGAQADPSTDPLVFTSLVAERDTLDSGESTKIEAKATGYNLSYNWSATLGNILGSGSVIEYAVSPCHVGTNKITCTINDGNNQSESKSLQIIVQ
jgi:hypothetical protein